MTTYLFTFSQEDSETCRVRLESLGQEELYAWHNSRTLETEDEDFCAELSHLLEAFNLNFTLEQF